MEAKKDEIMGWLILEIEGIPAHIYYPAQVYGTRSYARLEAFGVVKRYYKENPLPVSGEVKTHRVTVGQCDREGDIVQTDDGLTVAVKVAAFADTGEEDLVISQFFEPRPLKA